MEKIKVLAENNTQSALNTLIKKTLEEDEKMEEDLDFLFDNNANQKKRKRKKEKKSKKKKKEKKKKYTSDTKNKTLQHNQDKSKKFYGKFFV